MCCCSRNYHLHVVDDNLRRRLITLAVKYEREGRPAREQGIAVVLGPPQPVILHLPIEDDQKAKENGTIVSFPEAHHLMRENRGWSSKDAAKEAQRQGCDTDQRARLAFDENILQTLAVHRAAVSIRDERCMVGADIEIDPAHSASPASTVTCPLPARTSAAWPRQVSPPSRSGGLASRAGAGDSCESAPNVASPDNVKDQLAILPGAPPPRLTNTASRLGHKPAAGSTAKPDLFGPNNLCKSDDSDGDKKPAAHPSTGASALDDDDDDDTSAGSVVITKVVKKEKKPTASAVAARQSTGTGTLDNDDGSVIYVPTVKPDPTPPIDLRLVCQGL